MRLLCSLTRISLRSRRLSKNVSLVHLHLDISKRFVKRAFRYGRNFFKCLCKSCLLRSVNCSKSMKNWRRVSTLKAAAAAKAPLQQKTLKMFLGGNGAVCSAFLCTEGIYSTREIELLRSFLGQQTAKEAKWKNSNTSTVTKYDVVEKSLYFKNAETKLSAA